MTDAVVAHTDRAGREAGLELGAHLRDSLGGASPDALILFASPRLDHAALLDGIHEGCAPTLLVGCSSAGEFTRGMQGEGRACALALRSPEMRFSVGVGRRLGSDPGAAAAEVVDAFRGLGAHEYRHRTALVLCDALAGQAELFVEQLTLLTSGMYRFFGGGAGDDAQRRRTPVFCGREVVEDAVVALEILSEKPVGLGVQHGWSPVGAPMRVTEADGMRVVGLNAAPAVEAFEAHAAATGQRLDREDPLPFFLHNVLGIRTGDGYKLRVPLGVGADGSVACAAEVPVGATVSFMSTPGISAAEAAAAATRDALAQLDGHRPGVALFFDCVATRLRMGRDFGVELESLGAELAGARYVGFNTYGQVARAEGQFSGFHNCTAVCCVLPG